MNRMRSHQQGYVLIVCLVILVLMTLMAATAYNISNSSLIIVGNMQAQNEGRMAAQQILEQAISTTRFYTNPTAVLFNTTTTQYSNTVTVDINGDNVADETVTLQTPVCLRYQDVSEGSLNLANADDQACATQNTDFGVAGGMAASGNSLCADSEWEISAVAVDSNSGAQQTVSAGLKLRTSTDYTTKMCP